MRTELAEKIKQLGDKERKVLEHFLEHGRKKAAYLSYYHKAIPEQVEKFFRRKDVRDIIRECKQDAEKKTVEILEKKSITKANMQERLQKLMDFNIRKFLQPVFDSEGKHTGMAYNFSSATDDDWYCIQEFTCNRVMRGADQDLYPVENIKLKGIDKLKALELGLKTVGGLTDKVEMSEKVTVIFEDDYGS